MITHPPYSHPNQHINIISYHIFQCFSTTFISASVRNSKLCITFSDILVHGSSTASNSFKNTFFKYSIFSSSFDNLLVYSRLMISVCFSYSRVLRIRGGVLVVDLLLEEGDWVKEGVLDSSLSLS